jgi:hypothetical protein
MSDCSGALHVAATTGCEAVATTGSKEAAKDYTKITPHLP